MTDKQPPVVIDNATGFIFDDTNEEKLADQSAEELFDTEDNAQKTSVVIADFVASYSQHKNTIPLEEWLNQEFSNYPELWRDETERHETAQQIITSIQQANQAKADLYAHLDKGKSRESWLAKKIEQGASSAGVVDVGRYAQSIDEALEKATDTMKAMVFNKNLEVSSSPQLHGFIAEAELANQFNINATTLGSTLRNQDLITS